MDLPEATRDLGEVATGRWRQFDAQRTARPVGENQDANGWRQRQAEIEFDETRGHRRAARVYGGVPGGQTALQALGVELQADRNLGDAVPLGEFGRLRPQLLRNARTARAGAPPLGKCRGGFG